MSQEPENIDRRWSVICLTEDGKQLAEGLTKEEAITLKKQHAEGSEANPKPGLTTFHMAEVKHPELARDRLNLMDMVHYLGVEGSLPAMVVLTTDLLLIDEFFEKYPKVPKSVLKQPAVKNTSLWKRIWPGRN